MATLAGIILLLCQSTAFVNACTQVVPPASAAAAHESCLDFAPDGKTLAHDSLWQSTCDSQRASIPAVKVTLPAAADLPAVTSRIDFAAFTAFCTSSIDHSLTQAAPPPLTLIHCRLRN
ncbi:MAG: hypothetical protein HY526_04790 [Betaproteobacteria bacterium]|nr:hypothetical protein [Betaproteobacteria bacterium]